MSTQNTLQTNPFQEIAVYLSQEGNDLRMADLIKRFGFTVYAFFTLERMLDHLKERPLTAAAFYQTDDPEIESKIRAHYQGPIYELDQNRDQLLDRLGGDLRLVHRNQMKVQDPKVLRILKTFDAFLSGGQKSLLLLGYKHAIDLSIEYLKLFAEGSSTEIISDLPESLPKGDSGWYLTRGLFSKPVEWQQRWNFIFGSSSVPHVIVEEMDTDGLDALYLDGKVDELLYERLSFKQCVIDHLGGHSLEELCVQQVHSTEPRLIVDHEDEAPTVTVSDDSERKKGQTFFNRILRR